VKTLVLQITRLGDILYTVPALSALKRQNPERELHVLVRKKWAGALKGLSFIDRVWELDSESILGPVIQTQDWQQGMAPLKNFVDALRVENYDAIYNLSFSPSSSFITHCIASPTAAVVGYTRTSDCFLHIPDAASRYFKAQAGLHQQSRLHIVDIFSWMCGVEVQDSDFRYPRLMPREFNFTPSCYVVVHACASTHTKVWPLSLWQRFISVMLQKTKLSFVLVGTQSEAASLEQLVFLDPTRVQNWAGRTSVAELAGVIAGAKFMVGSDSGPMQVANCVRAPILNLSVGRVRFWETGPLVPGSWVFVRKDPSALMTDEVIEAALTMAGYSQNPINAMSVQSAGTLERYAGPFHEDSDETWACIRWMYFGGERPLLAAGYAEFLKQTDEVCKIAQLQLRVLPTSPDPKRHTAILDRVDDIVRFLAKQNSPLQPLFNWFFTEKENIGPGDLQSVVSRNLAIYGQLQTWVQQLAKGSLAQGLER